ncbi:MAG: type II secretion system F family protein [Hyphomicrobiaceae bacterium]
MLEIIDAVMRPEFIVTILASISAFATVLAIVMPLMSRDRVDQRMKVMALERSRLRAERLAEYSATGGNNPRLREKPKGFMQQIVEQFDLKSKFDIESAQDRLKMAGFRGQKPLVTYLFFRIAGPIILFFGTLLYVFVIAAMDHPAAIKVLVAFGAAFFGAYLPNIFLKNIVNKRQMAIKHAFPDSLDMLLICVQSGMSVEAAFAKVAKEAARSSVELAEELSLTTAELSYLPERRIAFENLGARTGIPGVKAVSTSLIQAERYGTPVSDALRVMAKENREIRMSDAEAKAAALPPKLTVPMILFFLPVLFMIILGPAVISVMAM